MGGKIGRPFFRRCGKADVAIFAHFLFSHFSKQTLVQPFILADILKQIVFLSFIEADILFQAFFDADTFKQIHLMDFFVGSRFYFGFKPHTLVGLAILTAAAVPLPG